MGKEVPVKQFPEDVTRESLIALSYASPDLIAETSPKTIAGKKAVEPVIHDGDEKYRSKLISLSSSSPPDVKVPPVLPGQPDA